MKFAGEDMKLMFLCVFAIFIFLFIITQQPLVKTWFPSLYFQHNDMFTMIIALLY